MNTKPLNSVTRGTQPFLAILALATSLASTTQAAIAVNQPAPAFQAVDIEGKTHRLSDYRGQVVVLEAINLDCPFSLHQYQSGALPELQAELTRRGVVWLLVNSTDEQHPSYREAAKARQEYANYKMKATAYLIDSKGEIGRLYGLKTTPHLVVIDAQGKVAYQGAIDDQAVTSGDPRQARNYVREAVTALLAGQAVAVKETKPYGCSVKYQ